MGTLGHLRVRPCRGGSQPCSVGASPREQSWGRAPSREKNRCFSLAFLSEGRRGRRAAPRASAPTALQCLRLVWLHPLLLMGQRPSGSRVQARHHPTQQLPSVRKSQWARTQCSPRLVPQGRGHFGPEDTVAVAPVGSLDRQLPQPTARFL